VDRRGWRREPIRSPRRRRCARGLTFALEPDYCVRTATLVAPRITPPESLKRTKIRFPAGSKGTLPVPVMKIAKVGVSLASICVVTLLTVGEMHCPVAGTVSHIEMLTGRLTPPVSAEAVI